MAQVQVAFEFGTDIDAAVAQDAAGGVSRIGAQLPAGVEPQVVAGSTDDIPVMVLAVGDGGDQRAMADKLRADHGAGAAGRSTGSARPR